jgi:acetylornithine deacetylase
MHDPLDILRKLVPIDSRNTLPIDAADERTSDEMAMCAWLVDFLEGLGLATQVTYAAPRRPNLVAFPKHPDPTWPTLAFQAHMDTVGTDGMTHDPFAAEIRDGRLYGRGACDTKGGMAAMLAALADLLAEGVQANLMFVATCAEETGCQGAPFLDLSPWRIDGMIVGEPTSNRLIVAHKTSVYLELVCTGKAAHSSRPEAGTNAIYRTAELLGFLQRTIIPELAAHQSPGFAGSTLSAGMIQGGVKPNIVPDRCSLVLDLRLVPDAPPVEELIGDIAQRASTVLGFAVEPGWAQITAGLGTPLDAPLVQTVQCALRNQGRNDAPDTVAYCTDAGVFAAKGIPCVVLGPGDILQAHGAVEYISIEELRAAKDIYQETAREWACHRA